LATDPILRSTTGAVAARVASRVIGGDTLDFVRCGLASERLDKHNYKIDGAQIGDSAEYFFDASTGSHLRFIDGVLRLVSAHAPVYGYIGVRFMPRSSALLSMARFPLTASVEVATGKSRLEDVYATFWAELHNLANSSQAIAHWGQEFRQSDTDIASRFGQNLAVWRSALGRVTENNLTFSTTFSRLHGLEPILGPGPTPPVDEDDEMIEAYLAGLNL
jgi:D-arabinono-1,4-lactone oxidase